jgi:prepilin-type N-terminal cleavage/methylation domain-containing protein
MPRRSRFGFTLVELLVGIVIVSFVGTGLIKLIMGQTRFMDQQEAWRSARAVSRSSLNLLMSDIRMVEAAGGLEAAAAGGQDFTLRVPYAFGVICSANSTSATASLMPVDSAMFAGAGFSGFAWRNSAGTYTYVTASATLNTTGTAANCTSANITTLAAFGGAPAGRVVNLGGTMGTVPPAGSLVFLFRRVRYEFKNSTVLPGRTALWRTLLSTGATEELVAPFDATARVRFFVLNGTTAQDAVPSPLGNTRGLQFSLDGMSENTPRGSPSPKVNTITTSVYFENRPD